MFTTTSSILLLVASFATKGRAQQNLGWDPSHRLDYTYDSNGVNNSWQDIDGLGEWGKEEYTNFNIQSRGNVCDDSSATPAATNTRPSPINLFQTSRCQDMHELLTRQINDGSNGDGELRDCTMNDVKYDITPYGLKIYFPTDDTTVCRRPTLRSSRTNPIDPYVLLWMELHMPSEHVIDGKRYNGELQMIHKGTGQEEGQLLTVSVLLSTDDTTTFDEKHENLHFQYMLEQWTNVVNENKQKCIEKRGNNKRDLVQQAEQEQKKDDGAEQRTARSAIIDGTTTAAAITERSNEGGRNLQFTSPSVCRTDKYGNGCEPLGPRRRMYPYNLWPSIWYFGYQGSLTSPPCTDIVNWFIIDEPM